MIEETAVPVLPDWAPSPALVEQLRANYAAAAPWLHVIIQDMFPRDLLERVHAEIQGLDHDQMRGSRSKRHIKIETSDRDLLGPATLALQDFLDSPAFVEMVSTVTGVPDLLADDAHYAAGIHETPHGGKTMVHTDFSRHPVSQLHHRVNVLLYLNPEWEDEWGGQLELWPQDMSALGARVQPTMNTMIIWETHAGTLHGLPDPIAGPPGTSRFAIAAYFYTAVPADRPAARTALGTYVARPGDSRWTNLPLPRDIARAVLPRELQKRLWALQEHLRNRRRGS